MYDPPGYFLASSQILDPIAVPQHNHGKKWCYGSSRDHLNAFAKYSMHFLQDYGHNLGFASQDLP
jgi:hypothetical protein